jgi:type VI secretion system protein ImpJ
MKRQQRVVWSKGMFLMPQHFQAQERFFAEELRVRSKLYQFAEWGVFDLEIDEDQLANRSFKLRKCSGVLSDGLVFEIPSSDAPPPSRPIQSLFPPGQQTLDVFLAIAEEAHGMPSVSHAEAHPLRFEAEDSTVIDECDGLEEPVEIARAKFRLLFGGESQEGMTVLQIAQLEKMGDGGCKLRRHFVPPCLSVGCSPYLMEDRIPHLLEQMSYFSDQLSAARAEESDLIADFSQSDIKRFWVLDVLNRALPELRHLHSIRQVHPEELYRFLLPLAGALCTFSLDTKPTDFPLYDHVNLGHCFRTLAEKIDGMLKAIVWPPTKCTPIPLRLSASGVWEGSLTDTTASRSTEFYLAVRARPGEIDLIDLVPTNVKIGGTKTIGDIIGKQLSGIALRHASPPNGCPRRTGSEFFRLQQKGVAWDDVIQSKEVRVQVLSDIPSPSLELFAVLDR